MEIKRITIFEEDRFYLAKGIFRLAQTLEEDSFEWKRLMNFRQILITGTQIVELTTFRLASLLGALNELEKNGVTTRSLRLRKKFWGLYKEESK